MVTETSGLSLPPALLNNDPGGFAWGVWHDRTPRLIAQIRDAHLYGPGQRAALDALGREVSAGHISSLPAAAPDVALWASWAGGNVGKRWADAPYLWSESYFYRRLLQAVDFFTPGPWYFTDPFAYLKNAELTTAAVAVSLAELPGEDGQPKLLAALWGNRADLGFRIDHTGEPARAGLVHDDSAALWAALEVPGDVIVVTDNAGQELLADLIFADHLLAAGHARSVRLHVKPYPWFVSDATAADVASCIDRLTRGAAGAGAAGDAGAGAAVADTGAGVGAAASSAAGAAVADRLRAAASAGRFGLDTHEFYCAPLPFHEMPADLTARYRAASLTIFKGDLNYRRLTGDRAWPPDTPFADVVSYFPGPLAALRTLKSDVIVGLTATAVADLNAASPGWRTDGSHALIQVLAARLRVARLRPRPPALRGPVVHEAQKRGVRGPRAPYGLALRVPRTPTGLRSPAGRPGPRSARWPPPGRRRRCRSARR